MPRAPAATGLLFVALIGFAATMTRMGEQAVGLPKTSLPPSTCPVTRPPSPPFVPPSPYPAEPDPYSFWYGTGKLWTALPLDGTWQGLPHYTPDAPEYRQKTFWWRQGYHWLSEPNPRLVIRGRRLDSPAVFVTTCVSNGFREQDLRSFMVAGIDIPTLGCWEITGQYGDDKLSYVIWVAP